MVGSVQAAEPTQATPTRDIPEIFRGTIGAEATISGVEPVLVSGLGVVTGLAGTGGGEMDQSLMATMVRELARNGVGRGSSGASGALEGMTPEQFLRDPRTAVVLVEAAIAPGSPAGQPFDVFVRSLPGASVTSLEGGTLWTTELRLGPAAVFGQAKTRIIAEAYGPVYLNPFSEQGAVNKAGQPAVMRTSGRVLGGGRVTTPLQMNLVLDNASHARARSVVNAINSRFPRGPIDNEMTAMGRGSTRNSSLDPDKAGTPTGGQSVALRVPFEYRERAAEFLQMVRFLRVDPAFPEEWAKRYADALKTQPEYAEELGWSLKALGRPAIPFLVPMYEFPELAPKLAALDAGAFLGDPRVVPYLLELAKTAPTSIRTRAIGLLGGMPSNPSINLALRELVAGNETEVRIAAYEALVNRGDPTLDRRIIGAGESRRAKFALDTVALGEPLIYVTQQGLPRMAILGAKAGETSGEIDPVSGGVRSRRSAGLAVNRPVLLSAWQDRFMMTAEDASADLRVFYRPYRGGPAITMNAPADLGELVAVLAQKTTPEDPRPGLDLSYSEVVGLVYEMTKQGAVSAGFTTEEDRLRASIFEASRSTNLTDRPESSDAATPQGVFEPPSPSPGEAAPAPGEPSRPRIVPIGPGTGKKPKDD
jgi:hypothetical protein